MTLDERTTSLDQIGSHDEVQPSPNPSQLSDIDAKKNTVDSKYLPDSGLESGSIQSSKEEVIRNPYDLVTKIISTEDDPTLPILTFRFWFIGLGLSIFGSVLAQIYYFKPQSVSVSSLFLTVISYIFGIFMANVIPTHGIFRHLNPGPFNIKEHTAIIIMCSSASGIAFAIDVLAVDRLFYNTASPNGLTSVFTLLSSQLIGYGFAGLLRSLLVFPTTALYPILLPSVSLFQALNKHDGLNAKRLKVFWICFFMIFFWEILPQYVCPILVGVSIFCLAQKNNPIPVFTSMFGGANGNEGLGFLSICFDWLYISAGQGLGPLYTPLQTQVNIWIGHTLCYALLMGVYYNNAWNSLRYPILAQDLYVQNGSSLYNQSAVLNSNNQVDYDRLGTYGLPAYAGIQVMALLMYNFAVSAGITHVFLFNFKDVQNAWTQYKSGDVSDPHYKSMQKYKEVPMWWYGLIFLVSFAVAEVTIYTGHSGLPWWSLLIALLLSAFFTCVTGVLFAITGFQINAQILIQMIGGYMHPGKPTANMYFTLYGYNTSGQALLMLRDLKLGQYIKIPPRITLTSQLIGTVLGAIFNYIMMNQIIDEQQSILLNPVGSTSWSGLQAQIYNSQSITWALANELFSVGKPYAWVVYAFFLGFIAPIPLYLLHRLYPTKRFDYINVPIISRYAVDLAAGINSSNQSLMAIGIFSQFYLRKYRPVWFRKYNYIVSAALDGGTQVIVFILTFAVFGASGKNVPFPVWGGNPNPALDRNAENLILCNDYCYLPPSN